MSLALRWTASDDMPAVSEQRDKDPDWVGKRQEACFIVAGFNRTVFEAQMVYLPE